MTLETQVHIACNPYGQTIPDDQFRELLEQVVRRRADDIESRHAAGEYERDRMAFAVLDPTAAPSADADDIVLAIAVIGAEGDFFAPNALAKAFCQREHGADGGVVVGTENHRVADESFRFGGAVELAGTIVGGSGQTPLQDRYQSTLFAADVNYRVAAARIAWEEANGPGRWYRSEQATPDRFVDLVAKISMP